MNSIRAILISSLIFIQCIEDNPTAVIKKSFDPTNTIKKISHYNAAGELEYYLEFTYDEEGRKKEVIHYTSQGKAIQSYALSYSGDNSIAKQDIIELSDGDEKVTGSHTCEYDSNGREIKMSFLDSSNTLMEYYINEYNSEGRIAKESLYSSDGVLQKYYQYEYDSNGINTITRCYLGSGELYSSSQNTYDAEGRILKESVEYSGKVIYFLSYEY